MILKRIEPLSCAKVYGVVCVFIGFLAGIFVAGISWIASRAFDTAGAGAYPGGLSFLFGGAAVITFPLLYGLLGFIAGFLSAVIYNWVAGLIGGIELEFE